MNIIKPGIFFFDNTDNEICKVQSIEGSLKITKSCNNLNEFKEGDIVGFRPNEKGEVYELFNAIDCEKEFKENKQTYLRYEWALILRTNINLLHEEILLEVNDRQSICINIMNQYLEEYNINEILDKYSIELVMYEKHVLGGDDTISLILKDQWNKNGEFNLEFNKQLEGNLIIFKDTYIHNIFPNVNEILFHQKDYYAMRMYNDFVNNNKVKVENTKERAVKMTKEIKNKALINYDENYHIEFLTKNIKEKLFLHREFTIKYNFFNYLDEYWPFKKLTGCDAFIVD